MLSVKNLVVQRGSFRLELPKIEVHKGAICVVWGKSGVGKSTFLHALAGFLPLQSGEIFLDDKALHPLPPEERRVALVFQKPTLFSHLRVRENVEFPLRIQKIKRQPRDERVGLWLKRVEISDLADRYPNEISGGQAQRVALARAFVADFPILALDEPFSSLDSGLKKDLRVLLKKLVRDSGVCAVMVSHDPQDLELADCRILLGPAPD